MSGYFARRFGVGPEEVLAVSAKDGTVVEDLIEEIVRRVPPPAERTDQVLRCLIFDSQFDTYRGVVAHVRVVDGDTMAVKIDHGFRVRTNRRLRRSSTRRRQKAFRCAPSHRR